MAGSWKSITPPNLSGSKAMSPDTMLLLTDGSVLVHHAYGNQWLRLTPDDKGDYSNPSWSAELDMTFNRQFFATAVLRDGRVCAIGGEYSSDTSLSADGKFAASGEMFDPETNSWSNMNKPSSFNWIQGDAVACMLSDGRLLLGSVNDSRTAIWDPAIDYWVEAGTAFGTKPRTKTGTTDEETWTLLQDGTVLTIEITSSKLAEKYLPESDTWISEQNTPDQMVLMSVSGTTVDEIGPAITLPDGTLFAVGGTGANAVYTPPASTTSKGSWSSGPNFPNDSAGNRLTAIDAPGVLLPNGTVLCVAGSTKKETDSKGNVSYWSNPTTLFVYDPNAATPLAKHPAQPPNAGGDTWTARFLLLPTGQVLMTTQGSTIDIYTPDAAELAFDSSWKPAITGYPPVLVPGHSYPLTGTHFNGLSHANSYGDDAQMATNYPIVRLTRADGKTHYLRTHGHSSMGIATGSQTVSTQIDVPFDIEAGLWDLRVIANGIPSDPVSVNVAQQDCILQINKTTYSQGEVQSQGVPATFDEPALYVLVEGFKPSELGLNAGNLGNPPVKPVVQAVGVSGMQIEFVGPVIPQDTSLPDSPQRFTYPFKVVITTQSIFNFAPDSEPVPVLATVTSLGANTVTSAGLIELTRNPNPFILDGDATQGLDWYLSVDMRVFQVKAGATSFTKTMPTSGDPNTIAPAFIQSVISGLNDGSIPASDFDGIDQQEDAEALQIGHTDGSGVAVYNFALARVRYQDTQVAHNLRLFFRTWPAQQTNATYDQTTLYRSAVSGAGQRIPLLGIVGDEIATIPFFAQRRVDPSVDMSTQTDPSNVRANVPASTGGSEEHIYFGCWLDINQPNDKRFPPIMIGQPANGPFTNTAQLVSIQQLVRSAHQCLIAEISFDPDPIPSTADPSTTDKLAQRNLTFVGVPNPGLIDEARRAPQTFELRPTPKLLPESARPDELMITWGSTPAGGTADIYLPTVEASTIFDLAQNLYTVHHLSVVDEHTVRVPTEPGGAAFVPVPKGGAADANGNFAGLITVNLPGTVRKGDAYDVTVRQITTMAFGQRGVATRDGAAHEGVVTVLKAITPEVKRRRSPVKAVGGRAALEEAAASAASRSFVWRRTIGVFDLAVPVGTKEGLIVREERLLSILRWIGKSIPAESRWYPVWGRYLEQLAGRVHGFGGDPTIIPPTPDGHWRRLPFPGGEDGDRGGERGEKVRQATGKVVAIAFDHFGDFEGFTIETEEGKHRNFRSRERRVLDLVRRAWRERLLIQVLSEERDEHEPRSIVFLDPPPFDWWRGR